MTWPAWHIAWMVGTVCLMPLAVAGMYTFDQVLDLFHERHREAWIKLNRPRCMTPRRLKDDDGKLGNPFAHHVCWIWWLFSTPDWFKDEPDTLNLLRRMRLLVGVFHIGLLLLIVIAASLASVSS